MSGEPSQIIMRNDEAKWHPSLLPAGTSLRGLGTIGFVCLFIVASLPVHATEWPPKRRDAEARAVSLMGNTAACAGKLQALGRAVTRREVLAGFMMLGGVYGFISFISYVSRRNSLGVLEKANVLKIGELQADLQEAMRVSNELAKIEEPLLDLEFEKRAGVIESFSSELMRKYRARRKEVITKYHKEFKSFLEDDRELYRKARTAILYKEIQHAEKHETLQQVLARVGFVDLSALNEKGEADPTKLFPTPVSALAPAYEKQQRRLTREEVETIDDLYRADKPTVVF